MFSDFNPQEPATGSRKIDLSGSSSRLPFARHHRAAAATASTTPGPFLSPGLTTGRSKAIPGCSSSISSAACTGAAGAALLLPHSSGGSHRANDGRQLLLEFQRRERQLREQQRRFTDAVKRIKRFWLSYSSRKHAKQLARAAFDALVEQVQNSQQQSSQHVQESTQPIQGQSEHLYGQSEHRQKQAFAERVAAAFPRLSLLLAFFFDAEAAACICLSCCSKKRNHKKDSAQKKGPDHPETAGVSIQSRTSCSGSCKDADRLQQLCDWLILLLRQHHEEARTLQKSQRNQRDGSDAPSPPSFVRCCKGSCFLCDAEEAAAAAVMQKQTTKACASVDRAACTVTSSIKPFHIQLLLQALTLLYHALVFRSAAPPVLLPPLYNGPSNNDKASSHNCSNDSENNSSSSSSSTSPKSSSSKNSQVATNLPSTASAVASVVAVYTPPTLFGGRSKTSTNIRSSISSSASTKSCSSSSDSSRNVLESSKSSSSSSSGLMMNSSCSVSVEKQLSDEEVHCSLRPLKDVEKQEKVSTHFCQSNDDKYDVDYGQSCCCCFKKLGCFSYLHLRYALGWRGSLLGSQLRRQQLLHQEKSRCVVAHPPLLLLPSASHGMQSRLLQKVQSLAAQVLQGLLFSSFLCQLFSTNTAQVTTSSSARKNKQKSVIEVSFLRKVLTDWQLMSGGAFTALVGDLVPEAASFGSFPWRSLRSPPPNKSQIDFKKAMLLILEVAIDECVEKRDVAAQAQLLVHLFGPPGRFPLSAFTRKNEEEIIKESQKTERTNEEKKEKGESETRREVEERVEEEKELGEQEEVDEEQTVLSEEKGKGAFALSEEDVERLAWMLSRLLQTTATSGLLEQQLEQQQLAVVCEQDREEPNSFSLTMRGKKSQRCFWRQRERRLLAAEQIAEMMLLNVASDCQNAFSFPEQEVEDERSSSCSQVATCTRRSSRSEAESSCSCFREEVYIPLAFAVVGNVLVFVQAQIARKRRLRHLVDEAADFEEDCLSCSHALLCLLTWAGSFVHRELLELSFLGEQPQHQNDSFSVDCEKVEDACSSDSVLGNRRKSEVEEDAEMETAEDTTSHTTAKAAEAVATQKKTHREDFSEPFPVSTTTPPAHFFDEEQKSLFFLLKDQLRLLAAPAVLHAFFACADEHPPTRLPALLQLLFPPSTLSCSSGFYAFEDEFEKSTAIDDEEEESDDDCGDFLNEESTGFTSSDSEEDKEQPSVFDDIPLNESNNLHLGFDQLILNSLAMDSTLSLYLLPTIRYEFEVECRGDASEFLRRLGNPPFFEAPLGQILRATCTLLQSQLEQLYDGELMGEHLGEEGGTGFLSSQYSRRGAEEKGRRRQTTPLLSFQKGSSASTSSSNNGMRPRRSIHRQLKESDDEDNERVIFIGGEKAAAEEDTSSSGRGSNKNSNSSKSSNSSSSFEQPPPHRVRRAAGSERDQNCSSSSSRKREPTHQPFFLAYTSTTSTRRSTPPPIPPRPFLLTVEDIQWLSLSLNKLAFKLIQATYSSPPPPPQTAPLDIFFHSTRHSTQKQPGLSETPKKASPLSAHRLRFFHNQNAAASPPSNTSNSFTTNHNNDYYAGRNSSHNNGDSSNSNSSSGRIMSWLEAAAVAAVEEEAMRRRRRFRGTTRRRRPLTTTTTTTTTRETNSAATTRTTTTTNNTNTHFMTNCMSTTNNTTRASANNRADREGQGPLSPSSSSSMMMRWLGDEGSRNNSSTEAEGLVDFCADPSSSSRRRASSPTTSPPQTPLRSSGSRCSSSTTSSRRQRSRNSRSSSSSHMGRGRYRNNSISSSGPAQLVQMVPTADPSIRSSSSNSSSTVSGIITTTTTGLLECSSNTEENQTAASSSSTTMSASQTDRIPATTTTLSRSCSPPQHSSHNHQQILSVPNNPTDSSAAATSRRTDQHLSSEQLQHSSTQIITDNSSRRCRSFQPTSSSRDQRRSGGDNSRSGDDDTGEESFQYGFDDLHNQHSREPLETHSASSLWSRRCNSSGYGGEDREMGCGGLRAATGGGGGEVARRRNGHHQIQHSQLPTRQGRRHGLCFMQAVFAGGGNSSNNSTNNSSSSGSSGSGSGSGSGSSSSSSSSATGGSSGGGGGGGGGRRGRGEEDHPSELLRGCSRRRRKTNVKKKPFLIGSSFLRGGGQQSSQQMLTYLCNVVSGLVRQLYDRNSRLHFLRDEQWILVETRSLLKNKGLLQQQERLAELDGAGAGGSFQAVVMGAAAATANRLNNATSLSSLFSAAAEGDFHSHHHHHHQAAATTAGLERVVNTSVKNSDKILAAVLTELPHTMPFEDRVLVFYDKINADRVRYRDGGQAFFFDQSVHQIRREYIVEDGLLALGPATESDLKGFFRVQFMSERGEVEEGVDAGGLFKEFLGLLSRKVFNPDYGLFQASSDNTLYPNPNAFLIHQEAKELYDVLGKVVGKALYEKILIEPQLNRVFLNLLLNRRNVVDDVKALDPAVHRSLLALRSFCGDVQQLALSFSLTTHHLGCCIDEDLIPNGRNILVTNASKQRYVQTVAHYKCTKQIARQTQAFRDGVAQVLPLQWLQMFSPAELQLLISGTPTGFDVDDLKKHSSYTGGFDENSPTIVWLWEILEEMSAALRSKFLMFVTSCSRPPLLGFQNLHPSFTIHSIAETDRLPTSSTCVNLLKLPPYPQKHILKQKLTEAIHGAEGFGLT